MRRKRTKEEVIRRWIRGQMLDVLEKEFGDRLLVVGERVFIDAIDLSGTIDVDFSVEIGEDPEHFLARVAIALASPGVRPCA